MSTPLSGLRVVEVASDIAGPYATKLLADAGADVVKVEHPAGGDPLRRWTACGAEIAAGDDGVLFRFLNASKRSVVLDWTTAGGRAALARWIAGADVVVESLGPEAGLDWPAVAAWNPAASLVSISWFGRSGPWASRPATEFTLQAWAGATALRGTAGRPPIAAGGRLGEWLGGGYAAIAALAAVAAARCGGRGRHADVSLLEVVHLSMAPFTTVAASFAGAGTAGDGVPVAPLMRTTELPSIEPAADGWVGFCTITNQQWRDFLVLVERDDLVDDAGLAHHLTREERRAEVTAFVQAWTRRHTVAEIIERATLLRIPVAPIGNGETVTGFDHFRWRGVFVAQPAAGGDPAPPVRRSLVQPRVPYRLERSALPPLRPAPRLGEHSDDPAWARRGDGCGERAGEHTDASLAAADPADASVLPFAGLRVLDLTMFWAGPFVGHFLAALGADVIKVESVQRPDGIRVASTQRAAGERWWEWSAMFHGINAGKRGVTLDLGHPRGLALAKALAARVDVVVENFSPRVMDNLGLRFDDLARAHPGLVMLRMPAFGLDGPWRDRVGFAQTMEQVSGLAWRTGWADGPPVIPRGPCDPLAGMHAVLALLVALEHRRRTGEGQLVESTMVEAALNVAADQVLEWQAYGRLLGRDGNRGPEAAPQNVYACRGVERWLAVAVVTDAHWRALVDLLGRPAWAATPSLASAAGRRAAHDRVDEELGRWCAEGDRDELVAALLACGIPAAPVLHPREVVHNPQLRARGFFEAVAHPVTGTHELPGLPLRFSGVEAGWCRTPAPALGQHTAAVLVELLGVDEAELAELRRENVIGDRPEGA